MYFHVQYINKKLPTWSSICICFFLKMEWIFNNSLSNCLSSSIDYLKYVQIYEQNDSYFQKGQSFFFLMKICCIINIVCWNIITIDLHCSFINWEGKYSVKKYFQDLLSQHFFFCQISLNHLFSWDNLLFWVSDD